MPCRRDRCFSSSRRRAPAWSRGSRVMAMVAVAVPILVPNVVGLPRQRAAAIVEAAGLRVGPEPDVTASGRLVERQAPAANTRVARLTTIALFVAAPPAPPPAPTVLRARRAHSATCRSTLGPGAGAGPVLTQPPAVQTSPPPAVPTCSPGELNRRLRTVAARRGRSPFRSTPLLPPWLLSLLVAVVAIGVSTYKLWWPSSSPPPPAVPGGRSRARRRRRWTCGRSAGDATLRLEVMGRSLISMDVRVRVGHEPAEQSLDVDAGDAGGRRTEAL